MTHHGSSRRWRHGQARRSPGRRTSGTPCNWSADRSSDAAINRAPSGRTRDDPASVTDAAAAAGGKVTSAVTEEHGWLLGRVGDPFGHEWEIGRPLGAWPPGSEGPLVAIRRKG